MTIQGLLMEIWLLMKSSLNRGLTVDGNGRLVVDVGLTFVEG